MIRAASVLLALAFASESLFAQSERILERLPFEVTIDVVSRGEKIQIRKVLSCNMKKRLFPFVWDQDVNRVYHILTSKEVLIFELPHVCGQLNTPPGSSLTPLPNNYLPITYWVDNADSPSRAEEIVSYRYFTENRHRQFEVRSFKVAMVDQPSVDKMDIDQRLVGLIDSPFAHFDAYFAGLFAIAIPSSVWEKYPELAVELRKYGKSGLVDRNLLKQGAPDLLSYCQSNAQGIGPAPRCLTGPFDTRPYVVPAVEEGGVWRIKYDDVGVRRYVKFIDVNQINSVGCPTENPKCNLEQGAYRFEVDGKVYERSMRSAADVFFDVKKQVLLRFGGFGLVRSTFNGNANE